MKCLVPLTQDQERMALGNIGYDFERMKENVTKLREWGRDQTNLPLTKLKEPDSFYQVILICNKGDLEVSKQKLSGYYYSRTKYPLFFSRQDPLDQAVLDSARNVLIATLPKPTPLASRVTMIALNDKDCENFNLLTSILRLFILIELRGREEGVFNGEYVVCDAKNITIKLVAKALMPSIIRSGLQFLQNFLSAQIKGIIVINAPKFVEKIINTIIKPLLSKTIVQRVVIYSEGAQVLSNHFPQNILPEEYGGEEESLKSISDMWLQKGVQEKEWLVKTLTDKVEENKCEKQKESFFTTRPKILSYFFQQEN